MSRKYHSRLEFKKQMRLLPGHIIIWLWCIFTIGMLAWIVAASLSTSPEIMRGNALKFATGLHFENYVKAWNANNISVFFMNSLIYASTSMVGSQYNNSSGCGWWQNAPWLRARGNFCAYEEFQ